LALALEYDRGDLRGFLVRKQTKGHGTGNLVEGPLEAGSTVAIVDDVATTGGSSLLAVDAVEAMGCKVAVVIAVLDRLEGASANFEARGLAFQSLLTIRDLGVEPLGPA
jgi:orotate phosphoribosyltransferase